MRVLIGPNEPDLSLEQLYAVPRTPWLRANMISTLDGAAAGGSGLSASIGNAVDKRVFHTLRGLADAVLVGAGTARAEEYGPALVPLVVVSRRGDVPPTLRDAPAGQVLLATCASAPGLAAARTLLGAEHVLVCGQDGVDLVGLRDRLVERGLGQILSEGGPHLLRDLLAAGLVDELCATVVPRLVAGAPPRITAGPALDVPLSLRLLLEEDGTLLGRWFT